ncbi:MAG: hypothetical protein BWK76_06600 [Desulfobulbaceae bacterium A2]|nr:MAG: hypothetical protein BWK76_06600 [Desulfobulbaceae bacterium A2]
MKTLLAIIVLMALSACGPIRHETLDQSLNRMSRDLINKQGYPCAEVTSVTPYRSLGRRGGLSLVRCTGGEKYQAVRMMGDLYFRPCGVLGVVCPE